MARVGARRAGLSTLSQVGARRMLGVPRLEDTMSDRTNLPTSNKNSRDYGSMVQSGKAAEVSKIKSAAALPKPLTPNK